MLQKLTLFVKENLWLIAIVTLGAGLRLWGIGFGLPYLYHPDEGVPIQIALRVLRDGNFNPGFFDWPSLLFYLNALAYGIYFVSGKLLGWFDTPQDLPYPDIITVAVGKAALPEELLISRALTAVAGTIAIVVIYLICRRVTGNRFMGIVGALWLAVDPTNIRHSQFIRPDIFMILFSLVACYFAIRIVDEPRLSNYVLAGVSAGLAASSKYNGALIVVPIIVAHITRFRTGGWNYRHIIIAGLACILAFFATTPFALFEWQRFWQEGLQGNATHYATGHAGGEGDTFQWYVNFIWSTQGWLLPLALAEIAASIWVRDRKGIVLASFPVAYFAFINLYTVRFETTILPVMPFIILLVVSLVSRVLVFLARLPIPRLGEFAVASTAMVFALPSLQTAITYDQRILQPDARQTARVWIEQNLPLGSRIVVEPYSPYVDSAQYVVAGVDGMTSHPPDWYIQNGFEYLVFSYGTYGRFYENRAHYAEIANQYDEFFARFIEVKRLNDSGFEIRIYRTGVTNLPTQRVGAHWGIYSDWLELVGYDLKSSEVGKPLEAILYWRALEARREPLNLTVHLLDRTNREVAQSTGNLFGVASDRWLPGIVRVPWTIAAPTEPGLYRFELAVDAMGQGHVPLLSREKQPMADKLFISPFKVAPAPISVDELQRATSLHTKFSDAITLLGYSLQKQNETASVTLYWKSNAKIDQHYTVFVHLVDSTGDIGAQIDAQPMNGAYPTSIWDTGEIVRDDYNFSLYDLAPGEYKIKVGMYQYPSLQRLSITDADGKSLGDHLVLASTIRVGR